MQIENKIIKYVTLYIHNNKNILNLILWIPIPNCPCNGQKEKKNSADIESVGVGYI